MKQPDQIQGIKDFLDKSIQAIDNMSKREIDSNLDQLDSILIRHYDKRYSYIYKKNTIQNQVRKMINIPEEGARLGGLKEDYKRLLNAMLDEINRLGLPGKNDVTIDSSGQVSSDPSKEEQPSQIEQQPQAQLREVLLKTMEDQMSSAQWEELKTLIRKVRKREEPRSRIFEKLRNYGLEECSSILANILTNPEIIDTL